MMAAAAIPSPENKPVNRVLVCDDNRDNLLTLGVLLRSEGYVVHLAKNATEAINHAEAFRPDVALLDLLMPGRSGFDLALFLRRLYGKQCPILIAVTAHDTPRTEQQARASGFQHFLGKPYDPQALLRLIASLDGSK